MHQPMPPKTSSVVAMAFVMPSNETTSISALNESRHIQSFAQFDMPWQRARQIQAVFTQPKPLADFAPNQTPIFGR
jgi:hypothetical protein